MESSIPNQYMRHAHIQERPGILRASTKATLPCTRLGEAGSLCGFAEPRARKSGGCRSGVVAGALRSYGVLSLAPRVLQFARSFVFHAAGRHLIAAGRTADALLGLA